MSRILIVDDHVLIRAGVRRYLEHRFRDSKVVGEAESEDAAFNQAVKEKPDLVILDLTLTEGHGLSLLRRLRERFPSIKLLVYSGHPERVYAGPALQSGADGYVMKNRDIGDLMDAVTRVLSGNRSFSTEVMTRILDGVTNRDSPIGMHTLTEMELRVFELIATGLSNTEIADELGYGNPATINTHVRNIKQKLALKTTSEVRQFAVLWMYGDRN